MSAILCKLADPVFPDAHRLCQDVVSENQELKQTGRIYGRHYKAYVEWFDEFEASRVKADPSYAPIPALPITVAKVTTFLDYEMTRPKKSKLAEGADSTSTCGHEHAKQVVSALEHYRFDTQHLYPNDPLAQVSLRTDARIKTLQSAFSEKEPERVKKSHALKATGTHGDTYGNDELIQMSMSVLIDASTPTKMWRANRDRTMLLASSSVAFRGDSSRILKWSDLYYVDLPFHAKGPGATVRVLALLADNAKHNKTGRVDEHGALRHFHPELCFVGATGLLFFSHFHIINQPPPDFTIDFTDKEYGQYGKRDWYQLCAFSGQKDCMKEMSYETHHDRVKEIHTKNNVKITKVTHAGRQFTAKTARENGASSTEVKALGGWSDSGSYRACYDRVFPVEALLGAAMFNAQHPETHHLPRDCLEPPNELTSMLFPWVEAELEALSAREDAHPLAHDIALRNFLKLLIWLRTVILQDAAVLSIKYPEADLWSYSPFNHPCFRTFASTSTTIIAQAKSDADLALKNLPVHISRSFTSAIATFSIEQQKEREAAKARQEEMDTKFRVLQQMLEEGPKRKRRKTTHSGETSSTPASASYEAMSYLPQINSPTYEVLPEFGSPMDNQLLTPYDVFDEFEGMAAVSPTSMEMAATPQFSALQLDAIQYLQGIGMASESSGTGSTSPSNCSMPTAAATPSLPALHITPHHIPAEKPQLSLLGQRSLNAAAAGYPQPPSKMMTGTPQEQATKHAAWDRAVVQKYGSARVLRHGIEDWDWRQAKPGGPYMWIPLYEYQPVHKITDVWTEWVNGLNGYISTRQLEEDFGPAWRHNVPPSGKCLREFVGVPDILVAIV